MNIKKLIDKVNDLKSYPASPFFIKQKLMSIFTLLIMCTCLGIGISCSSNKKTKDKKMVELPDPDPDPVADPAPGSSEDNPIEIGTYAEFLKIRDNMAAHYKLTSNIDMVASCTKVDGNPGTDAEVTTGSCQEGKGFRPLGFCEDSSTGDKDKLNADNSIPETCTKQAFTGGLNGGGFKILNLYINEENDERPVGLFRLVQNGAYIKNLVLENAYISGGHNSTGTLAGQIIGGTVENVQIKKTRVIGANLPTGTTKPYLGWKTTGGITGGLSIGSRAKERCTTEDDFAKFFCSALGSRNGLSSIKNASVENDVEITFAEDTVGGLVGVIWGGGVIENSYSKATIKKAPGKFPVRAGGLVGHMRNYARISQSYAEVTIGEVSAEISMVGGLVGEVMGGFGGGIYRTRSQ